MITRTKDRPLLLGRTIQSVLQQTLCDLQMVIVNDGGDPDAVDAVVARHHDEARGRIRVVHHRQSSGMEAATNAGLRATDSRYVAILDDDDTWDPNFLELTVGLAEERGAMGVVTDTTVVLETVIDGEIRFLESFPFDPTPGPWMAPRPPNNLFRLISWNQFPPCAFVYRRCVLDDIGYYDESLPVLGDWDFNLRFITKHRIDHVAAPLAYYHHRPNDATSNSVHAGETLHEQVRLELLDRYLHRELQEGTLGAGFATNLLYEMRQTNDALTRRLSDLERRMGDLYEAVRATGEGVDRLADSPGQAPSVTPPEPANALAREQLTRIRASLFRRSSKGLGTRARRAPPGASPG